VSTLDEILPYAIVPGLERVYVCGCHERWVSIYLQSIRGLNLAWALSTTGRVAPGARVAVVGGGFAGLCAAAGLGRRGARVTLLERRPALLEAQRGNRVRSIHPHIHEWPRPGSLEPRAGLPLLDWSAAVSADMARAVLDGFAAEVARSAISVVLSAPPLDLDAAPYDAIVLALGVGMERSFGALPLRSYWTDDDIATPAAGPPRHHLVTGIGEGGVIDTLYLRLAGFSHAEIAAHLAEIAGMRPVEEELLAIEREIEAGGLCDADVNSLLEPRYLALPVPRAVDALLRSRARRDNRVTLNGPEPRPLAARADILNRFLLSRLVALGELDYLPGKIAAIDGVGEQFLVTLDHGPRARFDEVKVRHGTVPALATGFPEVWRRYAPARTALPHLTPSPAWPPGFFDG
jgi:hypothetical protein